MADQNANLKGYSYQEMSSKVEQADRSLLRSRAHEPTGEVESLRGRTDVGRMGDRVAGPGGGEKQKHARPSELLRDQQKKKKAKKQQQQQKTDDQHRRRAGNVVAASGGQSILELDNLTGYQPTTQTARGAYESILVRPCGANLLGLLDWFSALFICLCLSLYLTHNIVFSLFILPLYFS